MAQTDQDAVAHRIQSILNDSNSTKEGKAPQSDDDSSASGSDEGSSKQNVNIQRRRIGNRFWKNDKTRFKTLIATRGLKLPFELKEKRRNELKHFKELSKSVKEERERAIQARRDRRKANIKRREENARKAEIVEVIRNPAKLKKLKKKQLRNIEKRDTSGMV